MCRVLSRSILCVALLVVTEAFAQSSTVPANTTCNFDANSQVAVEYQRMPINVKKKVLGDEIPYGKPWAPGGKPMTMFTNAPIDIAGTAVGVGAYTLFLLPEEKKWTLIVSKSTDTSGKYDETQDLARIPMKVGKLPIAEPEFSVYFAHVAPTQCNMRIDVRKTRAWTVVDEKK